MDDLKGWMQEKEAVVTRDDYGYDLLGVQTLLSQHEGVEVSRNGHFEKTDFIDIIKKSDISICRISNNGIIVHSLKAIGYSLTIAIYSGLVQPFIFYLLYFILLLVRDILLFKKTIKSF